MFLILMTDLVSFCAADRSEKAPVVAGLRKPEVPKPKSLPKPPAEPKEIPGLPGVVRKAFKPAPSPERTRHLPSGKRKAPFAVANFTPAEPKSHAIPTATIAPAEPTMDHVSKRSRPDVAAAAPVAQYREAVRVRPIERIEQPPVAAPSPIPFPATATLDQLEEMSANFSALAALCEQLQEENAALKSARLRDDVETILAQQNEHVLQHGKKASELAAHWREEAERLAALVEASGIETTQAQSRALTAELAAVRQAMLDAEMAAAEKEKVLVQLQKRNAFLERYARVVDTQNKCIGTDDTPQNVAAVQVPSAGPPMYQARAMAPEGAPGSGLYAFYPAGSGVSGGSIGLGVDAPYPLPGQRTMPHLPTVLPSGSDMRLATAESVQGVNGHVPRGRRVSAPPAPVHLVARRGQNAADVSRQIQFYSNSNQADPAAVRAGNVGGGLAPVPEGDCDEDIVAVQHGQHEYSLPQTHLQTTSGSGPLPPRDQALAWLFNIDFTPVKGKMMYTHRLTGYRFTVGPAPVDPDGESDDGGIDMQYCPLSLGTAEPYLLATSLGETLTEEFCFRSEQRTFLMDAISKALAAAERHHHN